MLLNLNIGLLGHVDSGKTSLAKALSETTGTAAFDKHPQSQERGITIDLGFSALLTEIPENLKIESNQMYDQLQFTFVDCPGHASLIKTIIGGSQIIDLIVLVIDIVKGIQTQTSECIVIGEITGKNMLVVLNKIDLLEKEIREKSIDKMTKKIIKVLSNTAFSGSKIVSVSATKEINITNLINLLKKLAYIPKRNYDLPFLLAADHCFSVKGQGTIITGTVLQGIVKINDDIEIPHLNLIRKIKSIQMFRKPIDSAKQGDRVGLCLTKTDANIMERGFISAIGYIQQIKLSIIKFNPIKYYKGKITSSSKFHITIGHETTLATITLFTSSSENFDKAEEFRFLAEYDNETEITENVYAILEFDNIVLASCNALLIASKLDINIQTPACRISFYGNLIEISDLKNYSNYLHKLKIYKEKSKEGKILRIVNSKEIIVVNLFKKETIREVYIGMKINLTSGEEGVIDSTFGQTSKVKVHLLKELSESSVKLIESNKTKVVLKFKKYVFNKSVKILQ